MSGVTDALIRLAEFARARDPLLKEQLVQLRQRHVDTVHTLLPADRAAKVMQKIDGDLASLEEVLKGISLLRECSDRAKDFVSGLGEVWSATILAEVLQAAGFCAAFLDAREVLVVEPAIPSPQVLWEESEALLAAKLDPQCDFVVVTGFVCRTHNEVPTTLGRNGSDYSASIFGSMLNASEVVIWTDVDGVMSADPRRVSDAVVVPTLSYQEAIELANFGAKVLHPMTMVPAITKRIPIIIKNTFRPDFEGSRIQATSVCSEQFAVKGCTTIDGIHLLTIRMTGVYGLTDVSARLFSALEKAEVPVILGTLGSPGNTISLAVQKGETDRARYVIEREFQSERLNGEVSEVDVSEHHAILAIVGDGMVGNVGVSSQFFNAIGKAGINAKAIVQGPDERNISIVIDSSSANKALRAAHSGFYLSPQTLSVGLIGSGTIADSFLQQLSGADAALKGRDKLDIRLRGRFECVNGLQTAADLDSFAAQIVSDVLPHSVLIDCTNSPDTVVHYAKWLERGIHVITSNKYGNASSLAHYRDLQSKMRFHERHYLYESMICGALPVIETLADLIQTGDEVTEISGVFSGVWSEICSAIEAGISLKHVYVKLKECGLATEDFQRELSGLSLRQTLTILAREMGLPFEMEQITELPKIFELAQEISDATLPGIFEKIEVILKQEMAGLAGDNRTLRMTGAVSRTGIASIALAPISKEESLAHVAQGDNLVAFSTTRFGARPLIVQGPALGAGLTATALFADLLRLTRYLGSMG